MISVRKRAGAALFFLCLAAMLHLAQAQQSEVKTKLDATDVGIIYYQSANRSTSYNAIY